MACLTQQRNNLAHIAYCKAALRGAYIGGQDGLAARRTEETMMGPIARRIAGSIEFALEFRGGDDRELMRDEHYYSYAINKVLWVEAHGERGARTDQRRISAGLAYAAVRRDVSISLTA